MLDTHSLFSLIPSSLENNLGPLFSFCTYSFYHQAYRAKSRFIHLFFQLKCTFVNSIYFFLWPMLWPNTFSPFPFTVITISSFWKKGHEIYNVLVMIPTFYNVCIRDLCCDFLHVTKQEEGGNGSTFHVGQIDKWGKAVFEIRAPTKSSTRELLILIECYEPQRI